MSFFNNAGDLIDDFFGGGQAQGYGDLADWLKKGIGQYRNELNQANSGMNPYMQTGANELGMYQNGINQMANPNQFVNNIMSKWQMSPQAQFQMQQGTKAANAAAAASGQLGSGPNQEAMNKFGEGVASQDMNNFLNQRLGVYNNFLNQAGGLSRMGQQAAAQEGNWDTGFGRDMLGAYGNVGGAYGNEDMARANDLNNYFGSGINALMMMAMGA